MKLIPLHDRIVAKAVEAETKTAGGIIIPETAKEKPQEAEVVAVGAGRWENGSRREIGLKKGDKILYGKYAGSDLTVGGEDFIILREDDVLAVIES